MERCAKYSRWPGAVVGDGAGVREGLGVALTVGVGVGASLRVTSISSRPPRPAQSRDRQIARYRHIADGRAEVDGAEQARGTRVREVHLGQAIVDRHDREVAIDGHGADALAADALAADAGEAGETEGVGGGRNDAGGEVGGGYSGAAGGGADVDHDKDDAGKQSEGADLVASARALGALRRAGTNGRSESRAH